MKLLIISDIHAYVTERKDGSKPSYVQAGAGTSSPAGTFEEFLKARPEIYPDVIICAGDLGDQADRVGIEYSWKFLNNLPEKNLLPFIQS